MTAENVIPTIDSHGMGKTSDGIAATDWDRVHELALAVVNADDSLDEESHRRELLKYLAARGASQNEVFVATR